VSDWYAPYVVSPEPVVDPRGPEKPLRDGARIVRGGGWAYDDPYWVRSAYRRWLDMSIRYENVGFRCAYALR
jgi:formylglycine-generating enzyme required for sulfatase activity